MIQCDSETEQSDNDRAVPRVEVLWAGQGFGAAGADYMNTSLAKQGDLGSQLPPMPAQASWKAGSLVEVAWTVSAHHGWCTLWILILV